LWLLLSRLWRLLLWLLGRLLGLLRRLLGHRLWLTTLARASRHVGRCC
jgi:hypothetical protein